MLIYLIVEKYNDSYFCFFTSCFISTCRLWGIYHNFVLPYFMAELKFHGHILSDTVILEVDGTFHNFKVFCIFCKNYCIFISLTSYNLLIYTIHISGKQHILRFTEFFIKNITNFDRHH